MIRLLKYSFQQRRNCPRFLRVVSDRLDDGGKVGVGGLAAGELLNLCGGNETYDGQQFQLRPTEDRRQLNGGLRSHPAFSGEDPMQQGPGYSRPISEKLEIPAAVELIGKPFFDELLDGHLISLGTLKNKVKKILKFSIDTVNSIRYNGHNQE